MKKIILTICILFLCSCSQKNEYKTYEDFKKFSEKLANSREKSFKISMLIKNEEGERIALRQYDKNLNLHFVDRDYNYYSVDKTLYQQIIVSKMQNGITSSEEYLQEIKNKKIKGFKNDDIQGIETYNDTKKQIGTFLDSTVKKYGGDGKSVTYKNKQGFEFTNLKNFSKNDKLIIYKENENTIVVEIIINSNTSIFQIEVGNDEMIKLPDVPIK